MFDDTIVETKYGKVRGIRHDGKYSSVRSYHGIPYAKPPVGDLRWAAPVDPDSWCGVRDCISDGPICMQPTSGMLEEPWGTDFYYAGVPPMSEDCLYLNVTTAAEEASEKRPVFIWLHGGGSDHGFSYEKEFNPEELALKGIVVVSVGHRLNVFGYMALPQITEAEGGSGNYILLDDIKALSWVIENIEAFGGDPDCITVGGQSSGTAKAVSLACTEVAKGHVKRVINDSALCWSRANKTLEEGYEEWQSYLKKIGIDPELNLEELRSISPERLLPKGKAHIPGNLVIDGDVIKDKDFSEMLGIVGDDFDFMAGINVGEIAIHPERSRTEVGFTRADDFYKYCREMLGDLYDKYDFESLVHVTDENVDRESRRLAAFGLHLGDRMGNLALNRRFAWLRKDKTPKKSTYTYLFSRVIPSREEEKDTTRDSRKLLSWHSGELWYFFDSMRGDVPPARNWEEKDFNLADIMSSYWANFIKSGNPNGPGLPVWEQGSEGYIELGDDVHMESMNTDLHDMIEEFLVSYNIFPG